MKVIVIEDERVIRKGIVNKVKWDKFKISEVLEANNGEIGYEMIIKDKPDIIILDICLPKINGIELLRMVREQNVNSKIIILSGHDEFEYAQQAIKYGVENYLLKPSSPKEIENVLANICQSLNENAEKEKKYIEMKKRLADMIPFFKAGLMRSIITGDLVNRDEILNLSSYLNINLNNEYFIAAVLLTENKGANSNNPEDILIRKVEISQIIRSSIEDENVILDDSISNNILIAVSGNDEAWTRKSCFSLVGRVYDRIQKETSTQVAIGIGNTKQGIEKISVSYKEAMSALEFRFMEGSQIYYIGDISLNSFDAGLYPYDEEKKFIQNIKTGKKNESFAAVKNIIHCLKNIKGKYPVAVAKIHLKQLVYQLIQIVYELEGDISDLYGNSPNIYENVEKLQSIDEYEDFFYDFTDKLCDYISNKRYVKYTSNMRKIIFYVEQNYRDEDLNLEKIADHVGMHPNYVSHMFKKEKGESLTAYISKYRIRKAAQIILNSDSMKISDIAYEVGFNDHHYFTTCFRNIIGMTPTDYKQMNVK